MKKTGRRIYTYDKYGQGPYHDAYAGTVEYWVTPVGDVYRYETNDNGLAYTGKRQTSEYIGHVKDIDKLIAAFNAETIIDCTGARIKPPAYYYDEIYADIKLGNF